MAVFYKIQKNNNSKSSTNGKYYARAYALQTINTAGLITEIEKLCTVTDADVQAEITALVFVMNQKLQDGYRVKIDNFGSFKIGLKSKPAENLNDFSAAKHIVGSRVNEILKPYGRVFPPDPASIGSAMVGGIVCNNASGMNCGVHANSDRMMVSARIVLTDGTVLTDEELAEREAANGDRTRP